MDSFFGRWVTLGQVKGEEISTVLWSFKGDHISKLVDVGRLLLVLLVFHQVSLSPFLCHEAELLPGAFLTSCEEAKVVDGGWISAAIIIGPVKCV